MSNPTIKFNLYNVTDGETTVKVSYSQGQHNLGGTLVNVVTLYEKDYTRKLGKLFPNAKNDSDSMTDYFETSRVSFYEGSENYETALKVSKRLDAKRAAKRAKFLAA